MKSLGQMLSLAHGLCGTKDVTDWEETFLEDTWVRTNEGRDTARLSEKQVAVIERIYNKHFA